MLHSLNTCAWIRVTFSFKVSCTYFLTLMTSFQHYIHEYLHAIDSIYSPPWTKAMPSLVVDLFLLCKFDYCPYHSLPCAQDLWPLLLDPMTSVHSTINRSLIQIDLNQAQKILYIYSIGNTFQYEALDQRYGLSSSFIFQLSYPSNYMYKLKIGIFINWILMKPNILIYLEIVQF